MTEDDLRTLLYNIFLKNPTNLFLEFTNECEKMYSKPVNNISDLKHNNNKKIKGDIFELFCVLNLKYIKNYSNVWLLAETPLDILEMLSLRKKDMGIDIIVENNGEFYAVQCKYKNNKSSCLSWKNLSTFYALCSKTGPWEKHIVMTTCITTNYQGIITEKDVSYCLNNFKNIKKDEWLKMCKTTKGYTLNESILPNNYIQILSLEENKIKKLEEYEITKFEETKEENLLDNINIHKNEIDFNTVTDIENLTEKDKVRYLRLLKFNQ